MLYMYDKLYYIYSIVTQKFENKHVQFNPYRARIDFSRQDLTP